MITGATGILTEVEEKKLGQYEPGICVCFKLLRCCTNVHKTLEKKKQLKWASLKTNYI